MIRDYYPGKGCQCYAHTESECACNVDWTDPEVYELKDEIKNLEASVKVLTDDRNRWHELFEEGVKQQREAEELKKWKEAIEEQLDICGLSAYEPYTDPKKALEHLIGYNFESGYKEGENRNGWKEAIIEELDCIGIYSEERANDPRKALHHIICWHVETGMFLAEEERWHKRFKRKLICFWYSTPFPYWYWRMKYKNNQPPF